MRVQAFAAELAVEGLDERVVGGFAGSGEVARDIALIGPEIEIARHELAALVDPDCSGEANLAADTLKDLHDVSASKVEPHLGRRREPTECVTDSHGVEAFLQSHDLYRGCMMDVASWC
jgi:hypothetical protein